MREADSAQPRAFGRTADGKEYGYLGVISTDLLTLRVSLMLLAYDNPEIFGEQQKRTEIEFPSSLSRAEIILITRK